MTLPIIWKRRLHTAGGHPASALLADTQGLGESTVKHCAYRKIRSLHYIAACAILLSLRMTQADDTIERGSVIPIGQKSAEHVGTPITVETVVAGTSSRRTRKVCFRGISIQLDGLEVRSNRTRHLRQPQSLPQAPDN